MRIESRLETPRYLNFLVPIASIIVALILTCIILMATGLNPGTAMSEIFIGSIQGWDDVLVNAIPLIILAIGISVAFKMLVWNIGAEGQYIIGIICAGGFALFGPHLPIYFMLPAMGICAMIGGGIWGLLSGIPKALWNVNEVITSLLLNYVALYLLQYLVYGPWKGPENLGYAQSSIISDNAVIPSMWSGTNLHFGLIIAIIIIVIAYFVMDRSRFGFEVKVIGDSKKAAKYSGISIFKKIITAMFISGALAGLAGMIQFSALEKSLTPTLGSGLGYTAIIVAWLSRLNPFAIGIVSILMGALTYSERTLPSVGIPLEMAQLMQGIILFCVIGGDFFIKYRINNKKKCGR